MDEPGIRGSLRLFVHHERQSLACNYNHGPTVHDAGAEILQKPLLRISTCSANLSRERITLVAKRIAWWEVPAAPK
jgi:hypothetical protein